MVDITSKIITLRKAVVEANLITSNKATIEAIQDNLVPKGNVFEMAKAAGLLGIKKTSEMIPDCHPIPIEFSLITYTISELTIKIRVEVHTIYKTGVEVEAMHGAAVVAVTMYDMLKPIDKGLEIGTIKLISKEGGKSDFVFPDVEKLRIGVLVVSNPIFYGKKVDNLKEKISTKLASSSLVPLEYCVVSESTSELKMKLDAYMYQKHDLIIIAGSSGIKRKDIVPDFLGEYLDKLVPGISDYVRNFGSNRTPLAMFSRNICGFKGDTLILSVPGSQNGLKDAMDSLFPYIFHTICIPKS